MDTKYLKWSSLACILVLSYIPAWAQDSSQADTPVDPVVRAQAMMESLQASVDPKDTASAEKLAELQKQSAEIRRIGNACIETEEPNLLELQTGKESLNGPHQAENKAVKKELKNIQKKIDDISERLASCRILVLKSQEVSNTLTELQQRELAARLLARGKNFLQILQFNLQQPQAWADIWNAFAASWQEVRELGVLHTSVMLGLAFGLALAGFLLRRWLQQLALNFNSGQGIAEGFVHALTTATAHYGPQLLAATTLTVYLSVLSKSQQLAPAISTFFEGVLILFVLLWLLRVFLLPKSPAHHYLPLDQSQAEALGNRLKLLIVLVFCGFVVFRTLIAKSLPDEAYTLVRMIFAVFLAINLVWVIWLLGRTLKLWNTRLLQVILTSALIIALGFEWLGYGNLARFIVVGIVGTILSFAITWLVSHLLRELYDGLDDGRHAWQRSLRNVLNVREGYIPGMVWLRLLTGLGVWGGFGLIMLKIWGMSDAGLTLIVQYLRDGFQIGKVTVVPVKVLFAILALSMILLISGWLKQRLKQSWLKRTRLDRGAREALVTMSGYTGVAIGILIALSMAGVDFANLAIIAGALSVGIGFGLQNIVNNFVSGLILLFARPIRTGDWIVVGGTEGYVKQISIRSTQIQTFDQADVIVPNSELISGQVTNWMLESARGRLIVPIGVAYGTDPGRVRDILLNIAQEHPRVLKDVPGVPNPRVMFRNFGASSLDFELRCFIREIDYRIIVHSDINYAIDKAFREAGIEIPFPQQDIHLRTWQPDLGAPMRDSDPKTEAP